MSGYLYNLQQIRIIRPSLPKAPRSINLLSYKLKGRNASFESYSIRLADTNRLMACR